MDHKLQYALCARVDETWHYHALYIVTFSLEMPKKRKPADQVPREEKGQAAEHPRPPPSKSTAELQRGYTLVEVQVKLSRLRYLVPYAFREPERAHWMHLFDEMVAKNTDFMNNAR